MYLCQSHTDGQVPGTRSGTFSARGMEAKLAGLSSTDGMVVPA